MTIKTARYLNSKNGHLLVRFLQQSFSEDGEMENQIVDTYKIDREELSKLLSGEIPEITSTGSTTL